MNENSNERQSGSGSLEESVAALVAQLPHLATSAQVNQLETKIEKWKGEMNDNAHKIAAEKVKDAMATQEKAMTNQHEKCAMEFASVVSDKIQRHEDSFHKRTSQAPQKNTNWNAFFSAFGPFLIRWVLPIISALGIGYGGAQALQNNTTNSASHSEPEKHGE